MPLFLDAEGSLAGAACFVTSFDGRPLMAPRNEQRWLEDLATALWRVHSILPGRFDIAYLGSGRLDRLRERSLEEYDAELQADPLGQRVREVIVAQLDLMDLDPLCLVHEDYWPGNTVWQRGRLSAIVDWTSAQVGDPRFDIAQCRADLALMHGQATADAFVTAYKAVSGRPLDDLWFFDLVRGRSAFEYYKSWLPGYHDLGLRHLTPAILEARVRAFLAAALAHGGFGS
jgi:aminoglycoside phosphotransferase (APT) family kinase protein